MKRINRIFIPTTSPEDWKALLAQPDKQWRTGYSAKALAHCWEEAQGFPKSVEQVFSKTSHSPFKSIVPLLILPEYQVPVPGGTRPSQNDIFVLAHSNEGLMTIAVEGKVEEPFGPTVSEWLKEGSEGKQVRLAYIHEQLGLPDAPLGSIRYQLLHRTTSALIEAKWFHASSAMVLVHSFSQNRTWFEDYTAFLGLFDKIGTPDSIDLLGNRNGIDLYLSWVTGDEKYLRV